MLRGLVLVKDLPLLLCVVFCCCALFCSIFWLKFCFGYGMDEVMMY